MENNEKLSQAGSLILSTAIGIALFGLLGGVSCLWDSYGIPLLSGSRSLILAAILIALSIYLVRGKVQALRIEPIGSAVALVLVFFTDWLTHPYNFFQGPSIRGEIILGTLLTWLLLKTSFKLSTQIALILSVILLFSGFFATAAGRLLISDDHASFVFRLSALKAHFPEIPYYSTQWNGGFDARDFFATGALNIFFISLPVILFSDVTSAYNLIAVLPLFLVLPLSIFFAARILKLRSPVPAIAAILALSASLLWYRWGLKYGTVGFVTSASLLPLVMAWSAKLLDRDESLNQREAICFVIVTTLAFFWSASVLILAPLGFFALINIRMLFKKPIFSRIVFALLLLNIPWVVVFTSVSKVGQFVSSDQQHNATMADSGSEKAPGGAFKARPKLPGVKTSIKILREAARPSNPLLIFLVLPGLFLLCGTGRRVFIMSSAWLLFLGVVIAPMKPQLELDRMLIVFLLLSSIPTALSIQSLIESARTGVGGKSSIALASLVGGFLFTGPFVSSGIVRNRSVEQFAFAGTLFENITSAIINFSGEGRVLFAGCIIHELDGGHVAPLAILTGKPLMASSQFHTLWRYKQIIPKSFIERKDLGGVEEYLNTYNVTSVIAHETDWVQYFEKKPDLYSRVWRDGRFSMFKRNNYYPTYFYSGAGEIIDDKDSKIVLRTDTKDAVLKYNYLPFLKSSACKMTGEQVSPEVTLIKLSECTPGQRVEISSAGAFSRVLSAGSSIIHGQGKGSEAEQ